MRRANPTASWDEGLVLQFGGENTERGLGGGADFGVVAALVVGAAGTFLFCR
jgi:hypothetical protein